MARTHDPGGKPVDLPPIHLFYRDMMELIERMPHVRVDLDALSKLGANRERVLLGLAVAAFATNFITAKKLKERETTLRNLADDLNTLAVRVDQVLSDRWSGADTWVRAISSINVEGLGRPIEAADHMWKCAKWAEKNADALSVLGGAERKTQGTASINELFKYVKKSTEKNCTALLARLLNAAHDALGASQSFSEQSLKKRMQRYPARRHKASEDLQHIEILLRLTGTNKKEK